MRNKFDDSQLGFDALFREVESSDGWPDPARFPHNHAGARVADVVGPDLASSRRPLLIAGFTSLDRLVTFLAECHARVAVDTSAHECVRVLIGYDPVPTSRKDFGGQLRDLPDEVQSYWRERGISLLLCGRLLRAIEFVRTDRAEVRTSRRVPVHAKIYQGDHAITLGSSNFSTAGLARQKEANVRYIDTARGRASERRRFDEACALADGLWQSGRDYKSALLHLLSTLLQRVTWQEALARAVAELLEGEWAKPYIASRLEELAPLWPAQVQGIAQAIWILENVGSVLVADATGSGKTRMGVHLGRTLMNRIIRSGHPRTDLAVLLCPPSAAVVWEREGTACGWRPAVYSHGLLSRDTESAGSVAHAIQRAQTLAVDEAHNYLRRVSRRTRMLTRNMADHVMLFTATPINTGPRDLLAIIELLGADNFEPEIIDVLERALSRRGEERDLLDVSERRDLTRAIQRFTVRRTKAQLNALIDRDPECYRDQYGRPCRYPAHDPREYSLGETERDRELAAQIRDATRELRGLALLRSALDAPEWQRRRPAGEEKYRDGRLAGARGLAGHSVMAALRSSNARLAEHLRGSGAVATELRQRLTQGSGQGTRPSGVINDLRGYAGFPPGTTLSIPVPEWIVDTDAHRRACEEEIAIYERIDNLARGISDAREESRVDLLMGLHSSHRLVLAFAPYLVSLHDLERRLAARGVAASGRVFLATGQERAARRAITREFRHGSRAEGMIALCSDVMSESVNLQAASVVVHLEMPSVIRTAEQRIGRVDRMDSEHATVQVFWPRDADEFALRSSKAFLRRHQFVDRILGSNVPLPDALLAEAAGAAELHDVVTYRDFEEEMTDEARARRTYDELQDAFAPVRSLVSGPTALLEESAYRSMRADTGRVLSCVSAVTASEAWGFFAVGGSKRDAPRWAYLDRSANGLHTDLEAVARLLRGRLGSEAAARDLDEPFERQLAEMLEALRRRERHLLPRKLQAALIEMRAVAERYLEAAARERDVDRRAICEHLIELSTGEVEGRPVDVRVLAEWWLYLIQPVRHDALRRPRRKRNRPLLLQDLREDVVARQITTDELRTVSQLDLAMQPLEERIVAAILGVP